MYHTLHPVVSEGVSRPSSIQYECEVLSMIGKYFKDFDKKILKIKKPVAGAQEGKGKTVTRASVDLRMMKESLSKIVPSRLKVDSVKPIDSSGFSPEGVDLVVYEEYCQDMLELMGGHVPSELLYGMFHIVPNLAKESLTEVLNKVATAKKLNMYAALPEEEGTMSHIPSFIIAASSKYQFSELKNDIINYYLSKNTGYRHELDILMIMHKGIVVKNWREKRSFIALETKEDTFMWFFILMNEYLDQKKETAIDFRNYVKKDVIYNEY